MNIGFDSVGILGPASKNRGIGNYTKSFIFSEKAIFYCMTVSTMN